MTHISQSTRLRCLMAERGLGQRQVAAICKVHPTTVKGWLAPSKHQGPPEGYVDLVELVASAQFYQAEAGGDAGPGFKDRPPGLYIGDTRLPVEVVSWSFEPGPPKSGGA